ncbi:MAG: M28 family peptidase [Bacteroidales bacterium]|nr:M28 family peptidase [Bacteroidales bacterium]
MGDVVPSQKPELGDFQCNGAMAAAKIARTNPRELAGQIIEKLRVLPAIINPTIAGPGFINFDLAGTGEEGITVVNGSVYKERFALLDSLNTEGEYLPQVKTRGEACNSDHCYFYKTGVPCFYMYTMGGSKAYHDINDIPDSLSLAGFTGYSNLMIKFLEEMNP